MDSDSIPTLVAPNFTRATFGPTMPAPAPEKSNRTVIILVATVVILLLALAGLAMRLAFSPSFDNKNENPLNLRANNSSEVDTNQATPSPTGDRSAIPSATPRAVPPNVSSTRQAIINTLEAWAAAARAHDLNAHMNYFADRLDPYYLEHDVTSAHVRANLQPAYDRYYKLEMKLSNIAVSLEPDGTRATVTLDKTYAFTGDKVMSGSVKEMMWLSLLGGRWRITGIRDVQVYYQNK